MKVCNPLTQISNNGLCYDCDTDINIAASSATLCNSSLNQRFFTYFVNRDISKVDDQKNFYGILTLENFDINTNIIGNLQIWLQTNMVLTPTLDAYIPSIVFEAIPSNRAPTLDKKISLPFKIQLVSQLVSTTIITISFLSY